MSFHKPKRNLAFRAEQADDFSFTPLLRGVGLGSRGISARSIRQSVLVPVGRGIGLRMKAVGTCNGSGRRPWRAPLAK